MMKLKNVKRSGPFMDLLLGLGLFTFFLPFFIFDGVFDAYYQFNLEHGLILSFIKFAILATLGEVIGLRIRFP